MIDRHRSRWRIAIVIAAGMFASCSAPPPTPTAPPAAPRQATPVPPPPVSRAPDFRSESEWRRALAQHILSVNRDRVFEGRPPHPLKAIVVLELAVTADGRVQSASVMRAPQHARELGAVAVRAARASSPLPPPPPAVLGRGTSVRFTETWLFRQDDRFQLRTLAQAQLIQ
jgi:protein TonB